jgi:hypothetical protein
MTVPSPWGEAQVVGPQQATEHVGKLLNLFCDGPVGKAKPPNIDGTTTQPVESNPRLHATRRSEIASQSTRFGVRSLTIGDGQHNRFDTDPIHVLKQASGPEDLVIGVRGHDNQPSRLPQAQWRECGKLPRSEPGSLACPRVLGIDD